MESEEIIYRFPDVFDRMDIRVQKNFAVLLEALGNNSVQSVQSLSHVQHFATQ